MILDNSFSHSTSLVEIICNCQIVLMDNRSCCKTWNTSIHENWCNKSAGRQISPKFISTNVNDSLIITNLGWLNSSGKKLGQKEEGEREDSIIKLAPLFKMCMNKDFDFAFCGTKQILIYATCSKSISENGSQC